MSYVPNIISKFGGVRPMARAIGKPVSTVQSWKDRGSIPDDSKVDVMRVAQSSGIEIGLVDFFPSLTPDGAL